VQVYIEIASLPIPRVAGTNQIAAKSLTLPGGLRRRLLNIQHAPAICRPLDIDPSCLYKVGRMLHLGLVVAWLSLMLVMLCWHPAAGIELVVVVVKVQDVYMPGWCGYLHLTLAAPSSLAALL
jgi:hypothetical protein